MRNLHEMQTTEHLNQSVPNQLQNLPQNKVGHAQIGSILMELVEIRFCSLFTEGLEPRRTKNLFKYHTTQP